MQLLQRWNHPVAKVGPGGRPGLPDWSEGRRGPFEIALPGYRPGGVVKSLAGRLELSQQGSGGIETGTSEAIEECRCAPRTSSDQGVEGVEND